MEDLVQRAGSILDRVCELVIITPFFSCLWKLVHSCKLSIIGFATLIQTSKSFKVPFRN